MKSIDQDPIIQLQKLVEIFEGAIREAVEITQSINSISMTVESMTKKIDSYISRPIG